LIIRSITYYKLSINKIYFPKTLKKFFIINIQKELVKNFQGIISVYLYNKLSSFLERLMYANFNIWFMKKSSQ
jgi:hypothetical protein